MARGMKTARRPLSGVTARSGRLARVIVVWVAPLCATLPVWASESAALCDAAAERAAAATGVPVSVLKAITLTETGRRREGAHRPWPWTVNMEGKGVWFDDPDSAKAYVYKHYKRGARSFDVGCFQLNYKWHGQNFDSIEEMFQPGPNALYAAQFLADLYREKGDWNAAAGAYHSRTKKYADRYTARFKTFRAALVGEDRSAPLTALKQDTRPATPVRQLTVATQAPAPASRPAPAPRLNLYPLLQGGRGGRGMGSLVPVTASGGPGLFARREADG